MKKLMFLTISIAIISLNSNANPDANNKETGRPDLSRSEARRFEITLTAGNGEYARARKIYDHHAKPLTADEARYLPEMLGMRCTYFSRSDETKTVPSGYWRFYRKGTDGSLILLGPGSGFKADLKLGEREFSGPFSFNSVSEPEDSLGNVGQAQPKQSDGTMTVRWTRPREDFVIGGQLIMKLDYGAFYWNEYLLCTQ